MTVPEKILLGLGIFIVAALAVLGIIGYRRLKSRALEKMIYQRSISVDGVFVGETLELTETVSNPTWFPLFNLRIGFFVPGGITVDGLRCNEHTKLASVFNLPPFSTVTRKHTISPDKRNRYEFHNAGLRYRKFDYIFKSVITFHAYPDYFDLNNDCFPDIYRGGNAVSNRKYIEDPFFVSGIREYRAGDPMRAINFKSSARSFSGGRRVLMSNDYDSSRTFDTMIFLDLNSYSEAYVTAEELSEAGLKCACFLFCEAVKNDGRVGFAANRSSGTSNYVYIPCQSGELHTKSVLKEFAELNVFAKRSFSMAALIGKLAPELPDGADIYLVTPYVDDKTAHVLSLLERSGRNVQVIRAAKNKL